MSQTLTGGGREQASQVPGLHFKIYNLGPKSLYMCAKLPYKVLKMAQ